MTTKASTLATIINHIHNPMHYGLCPDASKRALVAISDNLVMTCECEGSCQGGCQADDLTSIVKVATDGSPLLDSPLHGWTHWMSVYRNAVMVAEVAGLHKFSPDDEGITHFDFTACAILFSLFHDCRRVTEGPDLTHGAYGSIALLSAHSKDSLAPLMAEWAVASFACTMHTVVDNPRHDPAFEKLADTNILPDDPDAAETIRDAIGMCSDADRIDLLRLGIVPDNNYLTHCGAVGVTIDHLQKNGCFK